MEVPAADRLAQPVELLKESGSGSPRHDHSLGGGDADTQEERAVWISTDRIECCKEIQA